jgi:hypothetical protein
MSKRIDSTAQAVVMSAWVSRSPRNQGAAPAASASRAASAVAACPSRWSRQGWCSFYGGRLEAS